MCSIKRVDEGDRPLPYYTRILRLHSAAGSTSRLPGYDAKTVHLIPGGRFLLTSGQFYCLWDLGNNAGAPARPFPIAEPLYLEGWSFEKLAPGKDNTSILLGTTQKDLHGNNCIQIHRAKIGTSNNAQKPSFLPVAALELGSSRGHTSIFHISDTTAVFWSRPFLIVWEWAAGVACKWCPIPGTGMMQMSVNHAKVFLSDNRTIFIWDYHNNLQVFDLPPISRWHPCPSGGHLNDIPLDENQAKFEQPAFCEESIMVSSTSPWQSSTSPDCFLCTAFLGMPYLRIYSVRNLNHATGGDPFLPGSLLAPGGRSDIPYGPESTNHHNYGYGLSSLFRCGEELAVCSRSQPNALILMILPVPAKSSLNEITPFARALTANNAIFPDEDEWLGHQFDFCPFSGRAVYIDQKGEVVVSDYVLSSHHLYTE
ncbi:hypothetical protein NMY22_g18397 [Coprinellus aureogranulatus]|nr:hypothetical protein NMY22_g18397 [Coprinellus aureogranulatus]